MALSVGELLGYIKIMGLSEAVAGLADVRGGFTEGGAAADRMSTQVGKSETALTNAGRAANVGAEGTAKYRAATLTATAATERYNKLLADESSSMGRLASAEAAVIRANERVATSSPEAAIARTNTAAKDTPGIFARTSSGMLEAAKSAVGLGVAFGAFETIKKVVDSGRDLTTALNGVQAASHATDKQMGAVRSEALGLGKDLTVPRATAIDAAQAIDDLVRSGMTLPRAMAAARPALLLASAAQVDTADSARFLGDTLDDFQLPASQAAHVANILAGAATSAGGGLSDMFQAIKYAGPFARAAQVPISDLVTTVAELAKGGIQGSMAGTGLRMMLQKLAAPTAASQQALSDLGVTAFDTQGRFVGLRSVIGQLHDAQGRFGDDSKKFLGDISTAFGARASTIVASLAHKGVAGYDLFAARVKSGDVQKYANLMNRGVSASFGQLGKQFTAAGIDIYQGIEPDLNKVLQLISKGVPAALKIGGSVLHPFIAGFREAGSVLGSVGGFFADMLSQMGPVLPVLEFLTKDVLITWAAFKGYGVARTAVKAVLDGITALRTQATAGLASARAYGSGVQAVFAGNGTAAQKAALQQQAASAEAAAATDQEALSVARAKAREAAAYVDTVAASKAATDAQVTSAEETSAAAQAAATVAAESAATTAAAADAAAAEIDAAGETASIGWAGMLGPLAAVGIGIGLLTSLFHHNSDATKEDTAASQAYAASLKQSSSALAAVNTQATIKQLQDTKSVHLLADLHTANQAVGISQGDLVLAVNKGGQAYGQLHTKLQQVIAANKDIVVSGRTGGVETTRYNQVGLAAIKLSKNIDTLRGSFSKQQRQQMLSQTIERHAQAIADGGASAAARQAKSLGLTSNAYLDAQNAAKQNTAQTQAQIAAFQAENDAASILQQALDGLAGVNLNVATAQTSLASANLQVQSSFKTNKTAIDGNSQAAVNNQQAIQQQVQSAQQYAEAVGKKTKSTVAETAALKQSKGQLEAQLKAQGNLTPAVQSYIDKLYSLNKIHLKPTALDVDKQAADAKIGQLQTKIDKIRQGKVPGLTADNSPGAARIAQLQAEINSLRQTHQPSLGVNVSQLQAQVAAAQRIIDGLHGVHLAATVAVATAGGMGGAHAAGGTVADGYFTVGEEGGRRGWELGYKQGSNLRFWSNTQSRAMTGKDHVPGFAAGSGSPAPSGITTTKVGGDKKWVYGGQQYASLSAAENAEERTSKESAKEAREQAKQQAQAAREAARAWRELGAGVLEVYRVVNGRLRGKVESVADIRSGLRDTEKDLRQAGLPKSFIENLIKDNGTVLAAAAARNHAANQLEAANAAVVNAQKIKATDISTYKAAVTGSFDITTAGQNANGLITAGSLRAAQAQAVSKARLFVKDMGRLASMKIFPAAYLRQLAGAGPDALGEIQALLSMPKGQLDQFAANERTLAHLGSREAGVSAGHLDNRRIVEDKRRQREARVREARREAHLEKTIGDFREEVRDELADLHMKINWKTGDLTKAHASDKRASSHRGKPR